MGLEGPRQDVVAFNVALKNHGGIMLMIGPDGPQNPTIETALVWPSGKVYYFSIKSGLGLPRKHAPDLTKDFKILGAPPSLDLRAEVFKNGQFPKGTRFLFGHPTSGDFESEPSPEAGAAGIDVPPASDILPGCACRFRSGDDADWAKATLAAPPTLDGEWHCVTGDGTTFVVTDPKKIMVKIKRRAVAPGAAAPASSAFARLPRDASVLPPPTSQSIRHYGKGRAEQRDAYVAFFKSPAVEVFRSVGNSAICIEAEFAHGIEGIPACTVKVKMSYVPNLATFVRFDTDAPRAMEGVLTPRQHSASTIRLIHVAVREYGAQLGSFAGAACAFLVPEYSQKHQWKNLADIRVCRADLCYEMVVCYDIKSSGRPEVVVQDRRQEAFWLYYVGEALESCKRFHEAAGVYADIVSTYTADEYNLWMAAQACAVAHKRGGDFLEAEAAYVRAVGLAGARKAKDIVRAVRISPHAMQTVGGRLHCSLTSMDTLYTAWIHAGAADGDLRRCQIFLKLIAIVGFSTMPMEGASVVKAQFRSKPAAAKALFAAVKGSEEGAVERYRRRLQSCMDPRLVNSICFSTRPAPSARETTAAAKRAARTIVQHSSGALMASSAQNCAFAGCEYHVRGKEDAEDKFMRCPCKTVAYCSRAHQKSDWKRHKSMCPCRKKKQT